MPGVRVPKDWKPYVTFWCKKKTSARKARKVISIMNSRVVKVKEIYEQNTRGIFSSSVYSLCNILGACPGEFIEAIRCSTSFNGRLTSCARICVDRRPRYSFWSWFGEQETVVCSLGGHLVWTASQEMVEHSFEATKGMNVALLDAMWVLWSC